MCTNKSNKTQPRKSSILGKRTHKKKSQALPVRDKGPKTPQQTPCTDAKQKGCEPLKKGCKRCQLFSNDKKQKKKAFYCDVGMRAVLRQLRSQILKTSEMQVLAKCQMASPDMQSQLCLKFFAKNVLGDHRAFDSAPLAEKEEEAL